MHPRNPHNGRYDFAQLTAASPTLTPFVVSNPAGDNSIDFANPAAVKALNQALLRQHYDVQHWDVPAGYLCPPIPGRADYLHYAADLLATDNGGVIPTDKSVHVLDIGVGANCVYPIIGTKAYGWRFVGSETDAVALKAARALVGANPSLANRVELRAQSHQAFVFEDIVKPREEFDLVMCNPPFHPAGPSSTSAGRTRSCGARAAKKAF